MSDDDNDLDEMNGDSEDDDRRDRGRRGSSRAQPRRRLGRRPRLCNFCADRTKSIDYKQVDMLERYLTGNAKMRNRRQTGNCARHQRMLARAIKRARHLALLPYEGEVRR